jgi:hypothetical protein
MTTPTIRYRNFLMDSARWDEFPFRRGDIVISTPPKCGTTWVQMICALLIFQGSDFPRALDEMSVWPEVLTRRWEDVAETLAGQRHRRFVKTHVPLDGVPFRPEATYLCVGRDPRDAAISWDNHFANVDMDAVMAMRAAAVGMDDLAGLPLPEPPPDSPRERFLAWVDSDDVLISLAAMMRHLSTFWRARHEPNVVLLHYDDLLEDLEGQMRGLADRLGIDVPAQLWPELTRSARFEHMSRHADELTPEKRIWRDPNRFFHRGVSGQWRELLTEEDLRHYGEVVATLAEPDLVGWVHRGPVTT